MKNSILLTVSMVDAPECNYFQKIIISPELINNPKIITQAIQEAVDAINLEAKKDFEKMKRKDGIK